MNRTERHSETVSHTVLQFIKNKGLIRQGHHVIIAVSGGIDSMVLLDVLYTLRDILKVTITVAHVNHRLRGRSSEADERLVKQQAAQYGVPCRTTNVETAHFAEKKKISIQEAARELRYRFFDDLKHSLKANVIVTAHNADDNAETMLFHFFRGSGLQGMTGIPIRRGAYVRPLIQVGRNEIERYAKQHRIAFREDTSNHTVDYTRNFIRRTIIPAIEKRINPSLKNTLLKESEIFATLADFINNETEKYFQQIVRDRSILLKQFGIVHPLFRQSVVKKLLESLQIEPTFSVIVSVVELYEHQKGAIADINGDFFAERTHDRIVIQKKKSRNSFFFTLHKEMSVRHDSFTFSIESAKKQNKINSDSSIEYVDGRNIVFPLTVRSWKQGDWFIPLGMRGRKKLSDFLGEKKLTAEQKAEVPIILSGDTIIWVGGYRLDDRCKITEKTRSSYKLTLHVHGKKNDHR